MSVEWLLALCTVGGRCLSMSKSLSRDVALLARAVCALAVVYARHRPEVRGLLSKMLEETATIVVAKEKVT